MSKTYELSYTAEHIDELLGVVDDGGFVKGVQINSGEVETPDEHGKISLEVTKQDVGLGQVTNDAQVKRTEMGAPNGVATLESGGKIPQSQIPKRFQAEAVNFSDGGEGHMVTVRKEGDYDDGEEGIGIIGIEDQTISGSAIIRGVATPIGGTDAANKSYVDDAVSPSSNLVHKTGNETIFGEKIFAGDFSLQNPIANKTVLVSVEGVDIYAKTPKISFWDSDDDGDVRLSKVAEPYDRNDAATKRYVDSSIPDVSGFVTKSVNDLTNYYLKSETYTKAEVAALIGAIQQFHYEIYQTLPSSGESNVLYLIGPTGSGSDKYEEYVYSNNAFTKIGDTSIDLSGYVQKSDTTGLLKNDGTVDTNTYLTQHQDITGKADKVSSPTSGDFAGLDSNGNLNDSGKKASDFATAAQGAKADTALQQVTVGTTTTGAAGTNASVTNSGTATNPVLNFTIPRGADGADAYNPFKGTYLITDTLPTTGQSGDYIYVVDSQTPPVTHLYAWDGTVFSDTLETVTMGDSQFANSTKPISQTNVVNDFITGGEYDVASAETVKTIAETTMNYVEGSANILDPSTIKVGYYIYHKANDLSDVKNGTEQPIPSTLLYVYGCTDYIPIPQNGLILNKSARSQGTAPTALIFSDKNGTIIDRIVVTSANSPAIINPSGQTDWNYVRFNVGLLSEGESINDYCVYEGQTLPQGDPIPYVATRWEMKQQEIPAGAVTTPKLGNAAVTTSKIANGAVTVDKADFVVEHTSKNLCNPQDADFELNHYIRYNDGKNIDASSNYPNRYGATPFIPITEEGLVLNYPSDYGSLSGFALYKADKTTFVRGEQESGEYVYDSTTDSDAAYIRFTFDFAHKDEIQVEKGNTVTSYTHYTPPYHEFDSTKVRLPEQSQVDIRLDNRKSVRDNVGSLAANTTHSIAAFPSYLKKNIICSFEGKFSSTFSTTSIGFGNDSNAFYLIITGEKVYLKRSIDISATPSGTINNTEISHNLTITDYLRVSMKVSITKVEITIATRNGIFHHEYSLQSIYEFYGKPTIKSAIAFTDVVMSATSDDFTKNVWVVGDSLVSIYPQRWTHYLLREWGYDNWLLQGKAGGGSSTLWADLQLSLSLGMPKVLVWLLGTNDGDSDYESYVTTVCNYCDSHNITLILGKFPDPYGNTVTANRSWAVKNNYMLTTNKRYIDFRRAVTEEEGVTFDGITVGKWYGDDFTIPTDDSANWPSTAYINYDRVHPSIEGAKAEAVQVLIDCPELMQK